MGRGLDSALIGALRSACGLRFDSATATPVGGGCINDAWRIEADGRPWFVKLNHEGRLAMFEAEAEGLAELAKPGALRVPKPVGTGVGGVQAFLVLTWIDVAPANGEVHRRLGEGLARQHTVTADRHGWHRDNTIGSTPQINRQASRWSEFLRDQRLGYQLALAARNGYGSALADGGERLLGSLDVLLGDDDPAPSLLHGDLWGGNWAMTDDGAPVIFDPAVFYGDREADIAMTELFGGFGRGFYDAYRSVWPVEDGSAVRIALYKLYHVLNHLNLFGGGYLAQAKGLIDGLLRRL